MVESVPVLDCSHLYVGQCVGWTGASCCCLALLADRTYPGVVVALPLSVSRAGPGSQEEAFLKKKKDIIKSSQPVMLSAAMSRHPSHSPTRSWPNWPLAAVPRWCRRKDAAGRHTRRIPPRQNTHSTAVKTDAWMYNHRPSSSLSLRAIHASGGAAAERSGFILRAGQLAPSTGA